MLEGTRFRAAGLRKERGFQHSRIWHIQQGTGARRACSASSLSPHDEDVPVWQEGVTSGAGLPPSPQDWRAFRARLVRLERQQGWADPVDPQQDRQSWPHRQSQQQSQRQHKPAPNATATSGTAPAGPTQTPAPRRPTHPSTRAAAAKQDALARTSASAWDPLQPQCWAHPLPGPEVGCVLLACHDSEDMGPFFHRSVVLIIAHDDVNGTVGLVLNKASPLLVSEVTTTTEVQGFQSVFGAQRLQLGGPVRMDHVTLLHSFRGLPGAVCVAEGLFTGGLTGAVRLVQAGLASPGQFTLSLGVSGWAPDQLAQELRAGCWHCVAAAPELLLPPTDARRQRINVTQTEPGERDKGGRKQAQRPFTPHQVHAMNQPNGHSVPPLRPPPQHPAQAAQETCLWRRVMQAAQLV